MKCDELKEIYEAELVAIPKKIEVERSVRINKYDLFDRKLSKVIQYLTELKEKHGDVELKQVPCGYDDYFITLSWMEEETDEESANRIINEKSKIEYHYKKALKELRNKEIQAKIDELKKQLEQ